MSMISLLPGDKNKELQRKESLQNVYSSGSRLSLLNKRKRLTPLDMSQQSLNKAGGDRYVTQRVLSAKTHRVKQLQNQLADAHYHLQELSNENKVLRAVQKKQEIALSRYENSNAELPQVLNSHSEEMRIQQTKAKQLKAQLKEVSQKLKERDLQLQQLRDEHQRLLELSRERNLPEREKLQNQVTELSAKVQQQNETITMLQRKLVLEAKNFKHQLQNEINKHKDTRHDLDLAITNADKLSTIIEMKEKMLSTAASRTIKSPVKGTSAIHTARPLSKVNKAGPDTARTNEANQMDALTKLCENSRSLSSAMSHDEEVSSAAEPRSRYYRSRTNSNSMKSTPNQTRKSSKTSDDMIELAKTVQDGMAELTIYDDEFDLKNASPDEVQKKIEVMKNDLLQKIKNNEDPYAKKNLLRKRSTEESIEEQIVETEEEIERPKSRGRRSSAVSFYESVAVDESSTNVSVSNYKTGNEIEQVKIKREGSALERKKSGKQIERYCTEIIHDIEKSSKVIDKHMKEFNHSRLESDKLVQQLQAVDKINEFVNINGEIPDETLKELNNNFKMLTDQVLIDGAPTRKRSISGRRSSRTESTSNIFGDASLSNQDLLEDLLGKK